MMNEIAVYSLRLVKEHDQKYAKTDIKSPVQLARLVDEMFDLSNRPNEMLVMICVDTQLNVTGGHVISIGTLNESLSSPRDIYKAALLNNAYGIMLAHNHPAGNPKASDEDLRTTRLVLEAGAIIGIKLLDHVIIWGKDEYGYLFHTSMADTIKMWENEMKNGKKVF